MRYNDFLQLARYGNKEWKGNYTDTEIRQNAMNYYLDYQRSIANGLDASNVTTRFLLERLAEDWTNGNDEVTRWLKEMITELEMRDIANNPYLMDFIKREM